MNEPQFFDLATVFAVAFVDLMERPRRFRVDNYRFARAIRETAKNGNRWAQTWLPHTDEYIAWVLNNTLSMAQHAGLGFWCAPIFNSFEFYGDWRLARRYGSDLDARAVIRLYLQQLGVPCDGR